jgi:hypothetical protein
MPDLPPKLQLMCDVLATCADMPLRIGFETDDGSVRLMAPASPAYARMFASLPALVDNARPLTETAITLDAGLRQTHDELTQLESAARAVLKHLFDKSPEAYDAVKAILDPALPSR